MNNYVKAISKENHFQFEDEKQFGNTNIAGLQHKGIAEIQDREKFIKLDELTPGLKGHHWKGQFDYQYSSISDAIVSCLVRNLKNSNLNSADYHFAAFEMHDEIMTGTYSENYLKENEIERILSTGNKTDEHVAVKIDEYAEKVVDVEPNQRLHNLIQMFTKDGVPEKIAHDFLVQQAGFDILTGNNDRLNNPSNYVTAYNKQTHQSRPINLDYGRCLQISSWSQTMNDKLQIGDQYYQDDLQDFAHGFGNNDSIFKSYSISDSIVQLKENGFQPLIIDKHGLDEDLSTLVDQIKAANVPCEKFAIVKIDAFKTALESKQMHDLWQDMAPELSFEGLTEEGKEL